MIRKLILIWNDSAVEEKLLWLYSAFIPLLNVFSFRIFNKILILPDFIFIILFIVWLVKCREGKIKLIGRRLWLPAVALFIAFSLSLFNSVNLIESAIELSGLAYLVIFSFVASTILTRAEKLRRILYVYLFCASIFSLAGLLFLCLSASPWSAWVAPYLQYGAMEGMAHHFPRLKLSFESPNMLLAYLHVALVFAFILILLQKTRKNRLALALIITIIIIAVLFTGSRRITGVILSCFIILSWFARTKAASVLKYAVFSGFVFFFIASLLTSIWVIFPVKVTRDSANRIISLNINYAYSFHLAQPVASVNMFERHPIIGEGLGTYNRHFRESLDWDWISSSFGFEAYPEYLDKVKKRTLNFDPHSMFLGTLAEDGIIGFIGLLYFLAGYIFMLKRGLSSKSEIPRFKEIILRCILAGFIGYLLNALTMDILSMRHFWLMIAVGIAASELKDAPEKNG